MPTGIPREGVLLDIYRRAMLIKLADDRFISQLSGGELQIAYYSPRGQEIVSAATSANLNTEDYVVTIYRGLHDHLAKGVPLKQLWAEFAGKATGTCKGKGGPMHITHPESGVLVTTGIVGAGLPIANGLALASKLRGEKRVTVCNFGDGASNIGAFHEALNLASVWKLPVIFLCHNNLYAEHTPFQKGTAVDSIAKRAASYDMPGVRVNGNDALEMYETSRIAIDRARNGGGPTLIEAMTFRFRGHNYGDRGEYIPAEQYAAAIESDPVTRYRQWLVEHLSGDTSLNEIDETIRHDIDEAVTFMRTSPYPTEDELNRDVFSEEF
ncbi:thiamine pyrophosphate-dependent dehydrogenase E1 component subunit alpha [Paraburkholderia nodosa]|uniref:thiamine pyrophosphate-dependent dehydrogenase E1 component subunit alpha n=1 Tax=Paraburkholderia nodosa TaxID=392320 RepID=UPI000841CC8E|nr:thiamine pyrophosphate-dependent dehydrogenase E1 component subunit alpha [Paraburkholderia nodosa]